MSKEQKPTACPAGLLCRFGGSLSILPHQVSRATQLRIIPGTAVGLAAFQTDDEEEEKSQAGRQRSPALGGQLAICGSELHTPADIAV